MSRPRPVTGRVVKALIGIACGFGCVLPLLFVVGVVGGADARPPWSVLLLVAVIGIAASVFILLTLLRGRAEGGRAPERAADQTGCDGSPPGHWND